MELRHLRYFLAVAEDLHFTRAAERLHMAQPPLSQQILQLEKELDVRLFKRTRRTVELTDAGRVFQKEVIAVFERLEQGIRKAKLASRGEAGLLSIGFIGSSTYVVLPAIVRRFRERYPEVELVLQEIQSADQNRVLRERQTHVTFARFPKKEDGLIFESIYAEHIVAAVPEPHSLARAENIALANLAREPFILFPHQASAHADYTLQIFANAGVSPRIVQTVEEMHSALGLVAAGIGVTLVPSSMQKTKRQGIVYVDLAEPKPRLEMKMGYRADDESPVLARFIETVRSVYPH